MICAQGVAGNTHCVSLDALAPEYLASLPRDVAEPCPDYTGYTVCQDGGLVTVTPLHKGKLPGDPVTERPGCSTGSSASSSAASAGAWTPSASPVASLALATN